MLTRRTLQFLGASKDGSLTYKELRFMTIERPPISSLYLVALDGGNRVILEHEPAWAEFLDEVT